MKTITSFIVVVLLCGCTDIAKAPSDDIQGKSFEIVEHFNVYGSTMFILRDKITKSEYLWDHQSGFQRLDRTRPLGIMVTNYPPNVWPEKTEVLEFTITNATERDIKVTFPTTPHQ